MVKAPFEKRIGRPAGFADRKVEVDASTGAYD
jgi:hypothetical protein